LRVAELSLGTMTFGEAWGFGEGKDHCRRVWDAYVARGGNFIDTANKYTEGASEEFVGEFMASDRDRFVIATKYTLSTNADDPNASGNHRKNMMQAVEASLRRLKTDRIDLYWLHAWDFMTPVDEVMRGLDDLVRSGKVQYVGISDTPAWVVARANTLAELRGWSRFIGLQIEYSLLERTVERELVPMARSMDLGVVAWAPLGGGLLTGKYNHPQSKLHRLDSKRGMMNGGRLTPQNLAIAAEVQKVAQEIGKTPGQVALNWLRQQPGQVIPIVGARKEPQIKDSLGCLDFTLDDAQLKRLSDVSAVPLGFPHDFLGSDFIKTTVYGNTYPRIENHRA
jgi:aryl-alcohol dehydrogenase-like predicted oxidoreductase